jgi:hypothetical protein
VGISELLGFAIDELEYMDIKPENEFNELGFNKVESQTKVGTDIDELEAEAEVDAVQGVKFSGAGWGMCSSIGLLMGLRGMAGGGYGEEWVGCTWPFI